jgi:PAT family beta-lactamase induction signal transducer AmpG
VVASSSGVLAERLGWAAFFALTSVVTVPALVLLVWIMRRVTTHSNEGSPVAVLTKS